MVLNLNDIPFYESEKKLLVWNIHYHRVGYQCIKTTHDDCYLMILDDTDNGYERQKRLIYQPKSTLIKCSCHCALLYLGVHRKREYKKT